MSSAPSASLVGGGREKQQLYTLSYIPVSADDSQLPSEPQTNEPRQQIQLVDRRFEQSMLPVGPVGETMSPPAIHAIEMPELEPLSSSSSPFAHHKDHRNRKKKKKESKNIFRSSVEWWREDLSHDERKCIVYAGCCCFICGGVPLCPSPCACASPCGNNCCGSQTCTDCLPVDFIKDLTRCGTGDCFAQCDTLNSCGGGGGGCCGCCGGGGCNGCASGCNSCLCCGSSGSCSIM